MATSNAGISFHKVVATRVQDRICLTVKATTNNQTRGPLHIIVALDTSGSMAGSAMNEAKKALLGFVTRAVSDVHLPIKSMDLVLFNHTTQQHAFGKSSLTDIKKVVSSIRAEGGTNFCIALDTLHRLVADNVKASKTNVKSEDYFVVFFTDGCDTSSSPADVQVTMDKFNTMLTEKGVRLELHTLGFTRDHDARLLSSLTRAGTVEGTFQFIQTASTELEPALSTISEMLSSVACSLTLRLSGDRTCNVAMQADMTPDAGAIPADQSGEAGSISLAGTCWVTGEAGSEVKIEMPDGTVITVPVEEEVPTQGQLVLLTMQYVQQRVVELIEQVSNGKLDRPGLQAVQDQEVAALKLLLADMTASVIKMKSVERSRYRPAVVDAQQLVNTFCSDVLFPALTGTLGNERIAALNALAYQHITKNRLKNRLGDRAAGNVDLLEQLEFRVKEAAADIDFAALDAGEATIAEYGACGLTTNNYVEALRDCDCLCLGLSVERPEAAIAEPALVVVKSICPTVLAAEAFLDAVQIALEGNGVAEEVHGGFGRGVSASVVVGTAQEPISGVLPLFINEAHWSIASHKMKPLMGWMCTLNVMGYSYDQVKKIPFLVLARALADMAEAPTEYRARVLRWVTDTAMAVYRQSPSILQELQVPAVLKDAQPQAEASQAPISYLTAPLARTVDAVPSTSLFLAQLLCAAKAGDIKLTPKECGQLWHLVVEEELRRQRAGAGGADDPRAVDMLISNLLVAPIHAKVVQPFVARAIDILGDAGPPSNEEMEKAVFDVHWSEELSVQHPALLAQQETFRKWVSWLSALVDAVEKECTGTCTARTSLPDYHLKVQAALLVQNARAQRNADRRAQIMDGHYLCPFTHPKNILCREALKLVTAEVQSAGNAAQANRTAAEMAAMGGQFAAAHSELSAAAVIRGFKLGSHLKALYEALCQPGVPLAAEKLQMLISGRYENLDMRADKDWQLHWSAWPISRSKVHKFVRVHHTTQLSQQQAVAMFPAFERQINIWYTTEEPRGFLERKT